MALADILGRGGRFHSNCRRLRLSTNWESYNPSEWSVPGLDIFGSKKSYAYKLHSIENRLWLADVNNFSIHFPSQPRTNYNPNAYHGAFYNNKPKSSIYRNFPPEIEYSKNGNPFPVVNNYFTPYLKGGQGDTVATFRIGGGPVIATTDFSAFWGIKHEISFVSDGDYDCDWVLVEGGDGEFNPPEVTGNPTPDPEPRTGNDDSPSSELDESDSIKNIDLITLFIYYQKQQYQESYTDYGIHNSYRFSGLRPFTLLASDVPEAILKPHGVTFFVNSEMEGDHHLAAVFLDKETAKKSLTYQVSGIKIALNDSLLYEQFDVKKNALQLTTSFESSGIGIPKEAKIWSYSYYPAD